MIDRRNDVGRRDFDRRVRSIALNGIRCGRWFLFFGFRELLEELDGGVGDHDRVALLDLALKHDALVRFLPHLGDEGVARINVVGEAYLDALEEVRIALGRKALEHPTPGVTERAKPVEDRPLETERLGHARIRVQRVPVATQSVEQGLVLRDRVFDDDVGRARRGHVDVCARTTLAAPAASTTNEGGHLALDQQVAVLVVRVESGNDESTLAFVPDVFDHSLGGKRRLEWKRPRELDVLLTVKKAVEAVVQTGSRDAFLRES